MEQYFTKYLTIDREIKDGELGLSVNCALYTHHKYLTKDYGKPVKLFLCSKNISFGGDIHLFKNPEKEYHSFSRDTKSGVINLCTIENGKHKLTFSIKQEECFKVIGVISDSAVWIKEGDILTQDDIQICIWPGGIGSETWNIVPIHKFSKSDQKIWLNSGYQKVIRIKGQCTHFH